MKDIEIVFLDIDGTIRNSESKIDDITKAAIKRCVDAGIKIVLCTGRSCKYAKKVAEELKLTGYLVSSNGAEVINLDDNSIVYNAAMDLDEIRIIYNYCKEHSLNFLINTIPEDYQTIDESYNRVLINDIYDIKEPINQIVVTSYNYEAMKNMLDNFSDDYKSIRISGCASTLKVGDLKPPIDYYIDINRLDSSKANGVLKLLEYLGIDKDRALACGDGINDYEMIKSVGIGVSMGNGLSELKEAADMITKKNDDFGVAYLLGRLLKEKDL